MKSTVTISCRPTCLTRRSWFSSVCDGAEPLTDQRGNRMESVMSGCHCNDLQRMWWVLLPCLARGCAPEGPALLVWTISWHSFPAIWLTSHQSQTPLEKCGWEPGHGQRGRAISLIHFLQAPAIIHFLFFFTEFRGLVLTKSPSTVCFFSYTNTSFVLKNKSF